MEGTMAYPVLIRQLGKITKNNPMGATLDTRSESWKKSIEYFLLKRKIEIIIPIKPP